MKIISLFNSRLENALHVVHKFRNRRWFSKDLDTFIASDPQPKVCILFGVRRTGKTTGMLQCIDYMDIDARKKSVFFQIRTPTKKNGRYIAGDSLWDLQKDIQEFLDLGYSYFFIDEATNLIDFQQGAEILSDILALQGAKIVLSGTDSLCLDDAKRDALLGRSIIIQTTFISFLEWKYLTSQNDLDLFAKRGGILGDGEQIQQLFGSETGCIDYIQSAYAMNMEHSIIERKRSNVPDCILDLAEEHRFEGAVQRVVEDLNHRITVKALRKEFSLSAVGSLRELIDQDYRKNQLSNQKKVEILQHQKNAFDALDEKQLIQWMAMCLRIRDEREITKELTIDGNAVISDPIVQYLKRELVRLQVLLPFSILRIQYDGTIVEDTKNILIQHGLKYVQAKIMAECLLRVPSIAALTQIESNSLLLRMEQDILGHVVEEIVLVETLKAVQTLDVDSIIVSTLGLPVGEIDLSLYNRDTRELALFEIKHASTFVKKQAKHLANDNVIELINIAFDNPKIVRKTVLINNSSQQPFLDENGISCMDISMYLFDIAKNPLSAFVDPVQKQCKSYNH